MKRLQKNNLINWNTRSKLTFTQGEGTRARALDLNILPQNMQILFVCVLLLCYTTFDFLFGSFEQKREKKVWKVARCLGFLCQDWKMLEILDHQTVLEQNLDNYLITKAKEVISANFLYSKYIKLNNYFSCTWIILIYWFETLFLPLNEERYSWWIFYLF